MVSFSNKPTKTEPVGNGCFRYRWNIREVKREALDDIPEHTYWQAEEVIVPFLRSNVITAAVIAKVWDSSYEQKLVNEYNSAQLGLYDEDMKQAKIKAYTDFLNKRNALKEQVDADCKELGIL